MRFSTKPIFSKDLNINITRIINTSTKEVFK